MKTAVILISGRGSNMRSIVEARTGLAVKAVISYRAEAAGLAWAQSQGIATRVVDPGDSPTREAYDERLAAAIDDHAPDLLLLAGYMRILTDGFIAHYPRRMLNIHPSLLPSFPGLHTHARALAAGVKLHGATVHVVTPALDGGPIVIQGAVPVLADDTEETLAARVLAVEHRIYPQAVRWFVEERIEFRGQRRPGAQHRAVSADYMISPRNARMKTVARSTSSSPPLAAARRRHAERDRAEVQPSPTPGITIGHVNETFTRTWATSTPSAKRRALRGPAEDLPRRPAHAVEQRARRCPPACSPSRSSSIARTGRQAAT